MSKLRGLLRYCIVKNRVVAMRKAQLAQESEAPEALTSLVAQLSVQIVQWQRRQGARGRRKQGGEETHSANKASASINATRQGRGER